MQVARKNILKKSFLFTKRKHKYYLKDPKYHLKTLLRCSNWKYMVKIGIVPTLFQFESAAQVS